MLFILFLVLLYGVVWLGFLAVAPLYSKGLAGGVELVCRAWGRPFEFSVSGTRLIFRSLSRPAFEADLATASVVSNTVFLLTLLLATPGMNLRNRGLRLLLGSVLLFLSHVGFVFTKVEVTLVAASHPLAGSASLWNTLDNLFEISGKVFFPVLIWLLLGLPYMMGALDRQRPRRHRGKPGRNAPCICGSGKKYKYCCGG